MRVETSGGVRLRGKSGDLVFYTVDGKTYARQASEKDREGGWRKAGRSERQRESARRFALASCFYGFYRESVSDEVWRVAAREAGRKPHGLFFTLNHGCFDGERGVAKPDVLRFAEGSLSLPSGLRVEAVGGGVFRAAWEAEGGRASAAGSDELRAGVIYDGDRLSAYRAPRVSGTRGDGSGEFELDAGRGTVAHVYLYFERRGGGAFSPSAYFRVETGGGEEGGTAVAGGGGLGKEEDGGGPDGGVLDGEVAAVVGGEVDGDAADAEGEGQVADAADDGGGGVRGEEDALGGEVAVGARAAPPAVAGASGDAGLAVEAAAGRGVDEARVEGDAGGVEGNAAGDDGRVVVGAVADDAEAGAAEEGCSFVGAGRQDGEAVGRAGAAAGGVGGVSRKGGGEDSG